MSSSSVLACYVGCVACMHATNDPHHQCQLHPLCDIGWLFTPLNSINHLEKGSDIIFSLYI